MAFLNLTKITKHLRLISDLYKMSDRQNKEFAAKAFGIAAWKIDNSSRDLSISEIRSISGIGPAIEKEILAFVENNYSSMTEKYMMLATRMTDDRVPYEVLKPIVAEVLEYFTSRGYEIRVAGSFRRRQITSKDLDFVVQMDGHTQEEFEADVELLHDFEKAYGKEKRYSGKLAGLPIDFRLVHGCMVPAMLYFTGPAAHNIIMRGKAKSMGYKLNEYGLFDRETGDRILHPESFEKDYYDKLGMKSDHCIWLQTDHVPTKLNDLSYVDQEDFK